MLTTAQKKKLVKTPGHPNRIREAMKLASVTQEQLADKLGLTQAHVSRLVRGQHPRLSLEMARRIADVFDCRTEDLFPANDMAVAS